MGCSKSSSKGEGQVINAYLKKQEKSQITNLTLQLKKLEKEEKTKPKISRRKEITKSRTKINKKQTKKTTEKISETKSWFFEKVNKIDKPLLDSPTKEKWGEREREREGGRDRTQINKIRNERGAITTLKTEKKG